MKTLVLLILALLGLLPSLPIVAKNTESQAQQAFSAAVLALGDGRGAGEKKGEGETGSTNVPFSYTQTIKDDKGNRAVQRFDATRPEAPWTTVSVEGEDLTDLQIDWSVPLQLTPSSINTLGATFCAQTDSHWVFCGKAPVSVSTEGGAEQLEDDVNQLAQQNLETRIWVDKQQQRFTQMRIRNREPFRPSTLAKVKRFEISLEFAPAWPQGPTITVEASRRLEGSYGFFISIDEHLVQTVSDVVSVQYAVESYQSNIN